MAARIMSPEAGESAETEESMVESSNFASEKFHLAMRSITVKTIERDIVEIMQTATAAPVVRNKTETQAKTEDMARMTASWAISDIARLKTPDRLTLPKPHMTVPTRVATIVPTAEKQTRSAPITNC